LFGRRINLLVTLVIGLGIFGFMFSLITDPMGLLKQALIIGLVIGVIFLLYKKFLVKRRGKDFSLYQKAAKQSARRYKQHQVRNTKKKKIDPLIKKPKKREHNLTVIEGKKGKKDNRAL
jgi:predicted lipid-binding transport protein (Tim44 family)